MMLLKYGRPLFKTKFHRSVIRTLQLSRDEAHKLSLKDPDAFWGEQAKRVDWFKPYDRVLTLDENGYGIWFKGGELNTCYNCVDRHVLRGAGSRAAIIYDSPVTNTVETISYFELQSQVTQLAAYLASQGVTRGDRVVIYMPNMPQAAVSMLACARLGAVHSVVFGGFAAPELATRLSDCRPKVVIAASCGIDGAKTIDYLSLLQKALQIVQPPLQPLRCVILQRPQLPGVLDPERDVSWDTAMTAVDPEKARTQGACVPVAATDPLYVLYTSGTTGQPKGVQRDTAGHAVALAYSMPNIYNIHAGDVMWAASDVGWVVGHSFGVYGPLLAGATTLMYEGKPVGTPDHLNLWRTAARHGVHCFFTAPTAIRAIRRLDAHAQSLRAAGLDLRRLRGVHLAGEHADTQTVQWLESLLAHLRPEVAVRDHWWQTETGWPVCADTLSLPESGAGARHSPRDTVYGSVYWPCAGYDLRLFSPEAHPDADPGDMADSNSSSLLSQKQEQELEQGDGVREGHIFLKLPLPPGALQSLYKAPERFRKTYLSRRAGFYDTGDAGYVDGAGRVHVMARTDDVLNVAGHRLSAGALEEAVSVHEEVAEAAVVGLRDAFKGQVPLALVVLQDAEREGESEDARRARVSDEVVRAVRERIGAVASLKDVVFVSRLPRTRSGKTLRGVLRQLANAEPPSVPPTVEDPAVVTEVADIIAQALHIQRQKNADLH